MKICIITNTYSSDLIGGSNVYVVRLVKELLARKNKVVVIAISPRRKNTIENKPNLVIYRFASLNIATSYNIGRKSVIQQGLWTLFDIYNPFSYRRIHNILKCEKPDIVHIHTPVDITLSAFDAVKNLNLPLVFTVHDYLLLCRRVVLLHGSGRICDSNNVNGLCKMYRIFTRKIVNNKPDIVIFPSNFISEMFQNNGFFNSSKNIVLPYGIHLSVSSMVIKENKSTFNVLYVGSLTKHKGIQVLIKAIRSINDNSIRLSIVGSGVYENTLRCLAQNDQRINFCGAVNNKDISGFYARADLVVVPSLWPEVLGIVIQEAFRAGVSVVGSRIGGIPELIKSGRNGFLFDAGNSQQLKEIIEDCMKNLDKLRQMGMNAKKSIEKYEMSKHINELTNIYREAIESNRNRI